MRKQLLRVMVVCAACLALGAQAQTSSGGSSSGASGGSTSDQPGYPGSSSTQPGTPSGGSSSMMSPTGRMGHQEMRASQLTGAPVTSTSGESLGTISDTIINPASGRVDFVIISLSGAGGAPGAAAGGKQVAAPWMLLRPSTMGGAAGAAAGQQPSFAFTGDSSKLQSAPSFSTSTDLSQPGWRQSVLSHYGMTGGGPATGGAETPGGTSGGGTSGGGTSGGDTSGGGTSGGGTSGGGSSSGSTGNP